MTTYRVAYGDWSSGVVTLTIGSHTIPAGQTISVSGITPGGYNGASFIVLSVTAFTISYAVPVNPGAFLFNPLWNTEPWNEAASQGTVSQVGAFVVRTSDYYLGLLTSEYQLSTNILTWLGANLQLFQDALACATSLDSAFSLQQAVGPQLDVLGTIIGTSRTVGFQPSGGVSPVLDDGTYRILLQAKTLENHWSGTIGGLFKIWSQLFPGGVLLITDHQNMTVSLYIAVSLSSILQDLISNGYIIPRPQGVLYNLSFAPLPMLGFDQNTTFIAGFDAGHFS